jgi:diguanylate cyclase (GGDEF)-like protein
VRGKHEIRKEVINYDSTQEWTVKLTLLYAVTFTVSCALSYLYGGAFYVVQGSFYAIAVTGALVACVWGAFRSETHKRLWQTLSFGMFSWLLSVLVSSFYMIQLGPKNIPSPNLSDIFIVAYVPIIFGIMFSLGKITRPFDEVKKQIIVNISMTSLAMFMLCFEFILMPAWQANSGLSLTQKVFTIFYPVVDWVLLASLFFASWGFAEKNSEGWLVYLLSAFTLGIAADVSTYIVGYQMSLPFVLLSSCGAIFIIFAAIDHLTGSLKGLWRRYGRHNSENSPRVSCSIWQTVAIPLVSMFMPPVIAVAAFHQRITVEAGIIAFVSLAINGLMIYRSHLLVSENAVLFMKTLRDGLTGLNNYRYFQEALTKIIQKAHKTNKPASLILVDIDNFSKFNSQYGHQIGDRALNVIGGLLASAARDTDEACRLSGDEFAIVLPKTNEFESLKFAELLVAKIQRKLQDEFESMEISVSVGVSTYPSLASTKDELLTTADGALYWAKLNGGNGVILYDPKTVEAMSAEERSRKLEEIAALDMVRSLARAVDARDSYTRLHSKRVGYLARRLAERMGLDANMIHIVEVAGILHDVGKIGISDAVLNKPGKLNNEEIAMVRNHPELSAQIVSSTSLKQIIPFVRSHHERWDGSGYPDGLIGEEIPLVARILAVADSFDAMTSDRPYRQSLGIERALNEIKRCSGSQFDPCVVQQFLAMYGVTNKSDLFEPASGETPDDQDSFGTTVNF